MMKQLLATLVALCSLGARSFAGPLDGVWINTDVDTRSIPKIEINGTQFVWWGKTHPQDSKYGPLDLTLLGESVNDSSADEYGYVSEDAKFADHVFTIKRVDEQLVLETFTIFKDNSKRSNYHETLTFKKQP